jgi:hypothetical protein
LRNRLLDFLSGGKRYEPLKAAKPIYSQPDKLGYPASSAQEGRFQDANRVTDEGQRKSSDKGFTKIKIFLNWHENLTKDCGAG